MLKVRDSSRREMVHRFAIGNVGSPQFFPEQSFDRNEIRQLLASGDPDQEDQGMAILRVCRWNILQRLPYGMPWQIAQLDLREPDFEGLLTLKQDPDWLGLTGGTGKLIDAVHALHSKQQVDERIDKIKAALPTGSVELRGITLRSDTPDGPFEIIEGHGRLVALRLSAMERTWLNCPTIVEVALGLG